MRRPLLLGPASFFVYAVLIARSPRARLMAAPSQIVIEVAVRVRVGFLPGRSIRRAGARGARGSCSRSARCSRYHSVEARVLRCARRAAVEVSAGPGSWFALVGARVVPSHLPRPVRHQDVSAHDAGTSLRQETRYLLALVATIGGPRAPLKQFRRPSTGSMAARRCSGRILAAVALASLSDRIEQQSVAKRAGALLGGATTPTIFTPRDRRLDGAVHDGRTGWSSSQ